jgi:hypothetical protein
MTIFRDPSFTELAVSSFDRTFRAIFKQSHEEVARLDRINSAMNLIETQLLDPERIQEMDTMQQIALMELLSRSQQSTIKNVMSFGGTLEKVRTIVSISDGIQQFTALPSSPDGEFPLLEVDDD